VLSGNEGYVLDEPSTGDACRLWAYPLCGMMRYQIVKIVLLLVLVGCGRSPLIASDDLISAAEVTQRLSEAWSPILSSCQSDGKEQDSLLDSMPEPDPATLDVAAVASQYDSSSASVRSCVVEYMDWYVEQVKSDCRSDCSSSNRALVCGPRSAWLRDGLFEGALEYCAANHAA
jgi:hypothetical protein